MRADELLACRSRPQRNSADESLLGALLGEEPPLALIARKDSALDAVSAIVSVARARPRRHGTPTGPQLRRQVRGQLRADDHRGGRSYFLKVLDTEPDWIMRVTGNTDQWEHKVSRAGLHRRLPDVIDDTIIAMALDTTGGSTRLGILMDDRWIIPRTPSSRPGRACGRRWRWPSSAPASPATRTGRRRGLGWPPSPWARPGVRR